MTALLAMVALAAATWLLRAAFILIVPADRLPPAVRDGLQHLPPAVLTALVVVELVAATSDLAWRPALLTLAAMGAAGVVVRRTGQPFLAVATGLAVALVLDLMVL